jgi:GrpB-like predicted nucleotidyltransferase (UPF0157 family)
VTIVPYDPRWPGEFEIERERIARALGGRALRIDHNGSTAVPGLAAKPVIDIQVSVAPLHPIEAYAGCLARMGYVHVPHADDACCPFFHRPATWPHAHHVHLVEAGSEEEQRTIAFRDYLREHAQVARDYETLKRTIADRFSLDDVESREAYAGAKSEFINRIVCVALAEGYPR